MTRDELRALAARVEQATGADRELDYTVAAAAGWPDSPIMKQNARRYTESLDAALTLVPAELWWRVSVVAGRPSANVRTGSIISPGTKEWEGHAATPALALTAAALRARAEEAPHD